MTLWIKPPSKPREHPLLPPPLFSLKQHPMSHVGFFKLKLSFSDVPSTTRHVNQRSITPSCLDPKTPCPRTSIPSFCPLIMSGRWVPRPKAGRNSETIPTKQDSTNQASWGDELEWLFDLECYLKVKRAWSGGRDNGSGNWSERKRITNGWYGVEFVGVWWCLVVRRLTAVVPDMRWSHDLDSMVSRPTFDGAML